MEDSCYGDQCVSIMKKCNLQVLKSEEYAQGCLSYTGPWFAVYEYL